jgi:PAS domain S-box-containing protein
LDDSRVIASELLGAVVSLIPDAAVVADPEGRIVSVNAHLEQLFRYSSGSLTGLSVEILIPERVRRRHQGLRASYMDDPQIRSMGAGLHLTGRRSDGTEFPIDISLAPITNSGNQLVVAAIRDVSQQRQAAAAQAELATIVSSSSDAIFTTSLDGHLTNWNPGAETLFGFNKEEILGQHIATLVPGHASDVLEELLGAAADNRHHAALDTRWSRKDGREVDVAVSISPLKDSAGEVIGFSSIVRDISVRKSAENEVRRLREHNVLIDDRERIARDLHDHVIQRLFAAGLGLQSSLAWIAESNARTRVSESVDILDEIIREIRNTIFSLGSQDDNELNLRAQILDVVRQTSTALGFDPSIEFDAAEEIAIPSRVISDAVACVREALSNVARHAHASHALVQVEVDATALRVTVSDDGIGIGPNSRTSGLGNLAERARLLGGTFEITNASTGGTRLQWVVPMPSQ